MSTPNTRLSKQSASHGLPHARQVVRRFIEPANNADAVPQVKSWKAWLLSAWVMIVVAAWVATMLRGF